MLITTANIFIFLLFNEIKLINFYWGIVVLQCCISSTVQQSGVPRAI